MSLLVLLVPYNKNLLLIPKKKTHFIKAYNLAFMFFIIKYFIVYYFLYFI